jgi:hypothetical protein
MTAARILHRIDENTNFINKYFLLCGSCFWSASSFCDDFIGRCPLCGYTTIDIIPICVNEVFMLDYNPVRGVSIEFRSSNEGDDIA